MIDRDRREEQVTRDTRQEPRAENDGLGVAAMLETVTGSPISWLLIFVPVSLALYYFFSLPRIWVFGTAALAIIPLAHIISEATGQLAARSGAGIGGLLNVTFGNSVELIIAVLALRQGLTEVVKASISGSIMGNVLFALGLSMLLGGWGKEKQTFNQTRAGAGAAMLFLTAVALVMPAIFDVSVFGSLQTGGATVERLSQAVAVVLIVTYALGMWFTLKTHREVFSSSASHSSGREEAVELGTIQALSLLLGATVLAGLESNVLVDGISAVTQTLGLTEFFVGVIVVAIVGNAAEYVTATRMAMTERMQLTVNIAVGSSIQIAAFVAPILVFVSLFLGHPLSLVFNIFEIAGITLAVIALSIVSLDGESNWYEGTLLIAVYLILATVFYFVPSQFGA